jgi:hypothetical protein
LSNYQHIIYICYLLSCSVKNCSIHMGLYIPYHLLQYSIEQCCRECVTCLKPLSMPNAFGHLALVFHFSVQILQYHFFKFTNFFGILNFFKILYKCVLLIEL